MEYLQNHLAEFGIGQGSHSWKWYFSQGVYFLMILDKQVKAARQS